MEHILRKEDMSNKITYISIFLITMIAVGSFFNYEKNDYFCLIYDKDHGWNYDISSINLLGCTVEQYHRTFINLVGDN